MKRVYLATLLLGTFLSTGWESHLSAQLGGRNGRSTNVTEPVFVPAPRELSRPLIRARKAIAEKNWKEAIEFLGDVLDHPTTEDYLIADDETKGTATSLRTEAQRLLGQVPRAHRKNYELRYSIQARHQLDAAVANADYANIAEITRRYFHTPAGYLATMLLGQHHLDEGRPIAAAACFQRIVRDPVAQMEHDPEASILLSICWILGKSPQRAEDVLIELKDRQVGRTIDFNGQEVRLFDNKQLALDWLVELVGDSPLIDRNLVDQWVMFRGDAQRNARSGTGFPLPYPQWEVPTLNEPDLEGMAKSSLDDFLAAGRAPIPSLQPLAVNDTVIMRSATHLIGVNIKSGKRTWVFPPWDHKFFVRDEDLDDWQNQEQLNHNQLIQRLWKDQVYGQASSDGKYVFLIDRPGFAEANSINIIGRGGVAGIDNVFGARRFNELKAAELEREGAFKWEIGGEDGIDEPKLAGAFFLGAPLPLHGTLYALCELKAEIRLLALDADTGNLKWSQQIASVESTGGVTENMYRRLGGASPSYADGLLICPTSAGAIVAVDLSTQSLAWGYQYPIELNKSTHRFHPSLFRTDARPIDEKSVDSTVTIVDGKILFQPTESNRVFCVDLLTGKAIWKQTRTKKDGISRDDTLYIAGVEEDAAILVGKDQIRAIYLDSGQTKWSTKTTEHGRPSGRGYMNRGNYVFPTTNSLLVKINLRTGEIVSTARSTRVLGNLICYGNQVISHGTDYVAAFAQDEPSFELIERAENDGTIDAEILKLKAQVAFQKDDLVTAVESIEAAYLSKSSLSNRRFLLDVLLRLLEADFDKGMKVAARYEQLLEESHGFEYLAAKVDGLIRKQDIAMAFDALMDLAAKQSLLVPNRVHTERFRKSLDGTTQLRIDRWFNARLQELMMSGDAQMRDVLAKRIEDMILEFSKSQNPKQIYSLLQLFGHESIGAEVKLELASFLIQENELIDAELMLADLLIDSELETRARAEGLYARLLSKTDLTEQTRRQFDRLKSNFGDIICIDNMTGKQFADQWNASLDNPDKLSASRSWNRGLISAVNKSATKHVPSPNTPLQMKQMQSTSRSIEGISVVYNSQHHEAVIRDSYGNTLAKVPMRPESSQRRVYINSYMKGRYYLFGNLMVAQMGYEVVGIDMTRLKDGPSRIWRVSLEPNADKANSATGGVVISNFSYTTRTNIWGETERIAKTRQGTPIGSCTQISSRGICFIRAGQLICIDPLTGEEVWRRAGVRKGAQLTGDDDTVFVVPDDLSKIKGYSLHDGSEVKTAELDSRIGKYWTHDRDTLLVFTTDSRTNTVRLVSLRSGDAVWEHQVPKNTKATILDNREIAFYHPDGKFEIVNLQSGNTTLQSQFTKNASTRRIVVEKRRNRYVVFCSKISYPNSSVTKKKLRIQPFNYEDGLVDGFLYCVDRKTGKSIWNEPIYVEAFNFIRNQPYDVPLIVFGRMVYPTTGNRQYRSQIAAIDERSGKLAVWEKGITTYLRTCEIIGDKSKQEATVYCGTGKSYQVKFTEEALPPGPGARLDDNFSLRPIQAIIEKEPNQNRNEAERRKKLLERLKNARPKAKAPNAKAPNAIAPKDQKKNNKKGDKNPPIKPPQKPATGDKKKRNENQPEPNK